MDRQRSEHYQALLREVTGKEYTQQEAGTIGALFEEFKQFIVDSGGSLIDPEKWATVAFIAWQKEALHFPTKEARLLRELKEMVQQYKGKDFKLTSEVQKAIQNLFTHWLE